MRERGGYGDADMFRPLAVAAGIVQGATVAAMEPAAGWAPVWAAALGFTLAMAWLARALGSAGAGNVLVVVVTAALAIGAVLGA